MELAFAMMHLYNCGGGGGGLPTEKDVYELVAQGHFHTGGGTPCSSTPL